MRVQIPYRLRELTGYSLNARDGEIGKLVELYFDDKHWMVRYCVVRTGSWLLGNKVLIVPAVSRSIDGREKTLDVDLTREQVKNCPSVNTELPVSKHYEQEYYQYYGWEPYWISDPVFGPSPYIPPEPIEVESKEPEHPHLRSSKEMKNYSIHARDGFIGHVADIIIDYPDWAIRYLEIDTRNWLPGKHVLIGSSWLERIDWAKREVVIDQTRETIEKAPPYDPSKNISREYQVELFGYYGKKFEDE